ncbi:MAG: hypothetical protein H0X13_01765 [Ramlibacter sp.]|nr:hypothetical protein [Ramlibacter sp.]
MNILLLYHSTQTYTNTVFEHVNAFARFSAHRYFFCHHDQNEPFLVDLSKFDAVVIHYCLRTPYDQISEAAARSLAAFRGAKVLFLQDEYEHTQRAWHWMQRLGIDLVFTVVPHAHVRSIYPPTQFPATRFVSNLTGYVPEAFTEVQDVRPPSRRTLLVGYRGRPLPIRFGVLGKEKVSIGCMVKAYCERRGLVADIAWTEEERIYGDAWYPFVASCRAMLGSESGSNVFDWDATLQSRIDSFLVSNPQATEDQVYEAVVAPLEMPGVMNQVSPRVFEAIAMRTVLVLFEGSYSGAVEPWQHYIPLRKDGSNLDEVFERLQDGDFVDAMAERAWQHVIGSGRYSYPAFVRMTDGEIEACLHAVASSGRSCERGAELECIRVGLEKPTLLTSLPVRWPAPVFRGAGAQAGAEGFEAWEPPSRYSRLRQAAVLVWSCVPRPMQKVLGPLVHGVLRPVARALHGVRKASVRRRPLD